MRIIIVGAGKVGFEIALKLSDENHDIVVIDKERGTLEEIERHLDVQTLCGNGASVRVLEEAGVRQAGMVIAVTQIDEVNMIACMTAKGYGVWRTVARIRSREYLDEERSHIFSHAQLGIDLAVNPERLAAIEIHRILQTPTANEVEYFADGRVIVAGITVHPEAAINHRPLHEVSIESALLLAIVRDNETIIPRGNTVVQPNDNLLVAVRHDQVGRIAEMVGRPTPPVHNVVILGGGRIGVTLAEELLAEGKRQGRRPEIKIIERDRERASELAEILPEVVVIQGDGTKIDLLEEERVVEADAFVAASGQDHVNLLAILLARQLGIPRAITEITREDYTRLGRAVGADATVTPRLLTASTILGLLRRGGVVAMNIAGGGVGETLEFRAAKGAAAIGRPLRDLKIPSGAIIASIVHDGEAIIPRGQDLIRVGDRVIVFCLPSAVREVERLFAV